MVKAKPFHEIGWIWYRFCRRFAKRYANLTLYFLRVQFRVSRRVLSYYKNISESYVLVRYRLIKRLRFRFLRLLVFFFWRLWVSRVEGIDKIPDNEAAIIVSNHLSYFDFFVLASVLKKQTVFIAVKNLDQRNFVGWFMKLDIIIYVDRDKPGLKFFKQVMWYLTHGRRLVSLYPEGTRSRSGKMLIPKPGFVKLAVKTGVPIIPIAMKGTYEILPPHKHFPKLRRCDVHVLDKVYVSPLNSEFKDIFFKNSGKDRRYEDLSDEDLQEIAFRIMDKVRVVAGQEWDDSVDLSQRDAYAKILAESNVAGG